MCIAQPPSSAPRSSIQTQHGTFLFFRDCKWRKVMAQSGPYLFLRVQSAASVQAKVVEPSQTYRPRKPRALLHAHDTAQQLNIAARETKDGTRPRLQQCHFHLDFQSHVITRKGCQHSASTGMHYFPVKKKKKKSLCYLLLNGFANESAQCVIGTWNEILAGEMSRRAHKSPVAYPSIAAWRTFINVLRGKKFRIKFEKYSSNFCFPWLAIWGDISFRTTRKRKRISAKEYESQFGNWTEEIIAAGLEKNFW